LIDRTGPASTETRMSDAIQHPDHESHEGPIKTPKQLIVAVVFSFLVPIFTIIVLVNNVTSAPKPAAGSTGLDEKSVAARLQRVGMVEVKDVSDPAALKNGQQVFAGQCAACHAAGVAGAPKMGDAAAWAPRLKAGLDALLASAIKGKGNMPPQAGGDFNELEVARAVVHMANASGGQFPEPQAAAVAGAASAPGAALTPAAAGASTPTAPAGAAAASGAAQGAPKK
jgi:cytochrome c5